MVQKAEDILKMENPGELFSDGEESKIKEEYKALVRKWHPDLNKKNPDADKVMAKINVLYKEGLQLIEKGKWKKDNYVQLKTNDAVIKLHYLAEHDFELGKMYVAKKCVFFLVEKQHKVFYDNYIQHASHFKFANPDMQNEFMRYLPVIEKQFETEEYYGLVVKKTEDVLPLRDVLAHFGGKLPDRHMAWVLSSLYNIACYLDFNKMSHNGLTVDNYFISPPHHSGVLLGGWFYAVPYGEKLIGAPKDVFDVMTLETKQTKTGTYVTDLDSIRQIGRTLCGDRLGIHLLKDQTIPKPVIDWLLGGAMNKPIEEYQAWGKVLDKGYGKRSFVDMLLTASDVYHK